MARLEWEGSVETRSIALRYIQGVANSGCQGNIGCPNLGHSWCALLPGGALHVAKREARRSNK